MSVELHFLLTFASDWHTGSGHGDATRDAVLRRDASGQPIISASTIKGLLRDALYELSPHSGDVHNGKKSQILANQILGSPTQECPWTFSTAVPVAPVAEDAHDVPGVRVAPSSRRAEIGKLFRKELGAKELAFTFAVIGPEDQEAVEWLVAAARYVRRMGSRRRRGSGKCLFALDEGKHPGLQHSLLNAFEQRLLLAEAPIVTLPRKVTAYAVASATGTRRFRVFVRAQQPVLVGQTPEAGNVFRSQSYISGRIMRGAFAAVAKSATGVTPAFLEMFVKGGVHFSDALLCDTQGNVYCHSPLGINKKQASGDLASLLLGSLVEPGDKPHQKYIRLQDGRKTDFVPARTIRTHVNIDAETKRADDGNLYTYDALAAGTCFVGEFTLKDNADWATLSELLRVNLNTPFEMHIGKGIWRGYGQCSVWIEEVAHATPLTLPALTDRLKAATELPSTALVLTLMSDTIVLDPWGRAVQRFDELIKSKAFLKVLGVEAGDISITKQFVKSTIIDSFDTYSGLPNWRDVGLARGSSALLNVTGKLDRQKLMQIEQDGIGLRRSEGFGQVVFNHPAHVTGTQGSTLTIPQTLTQTTSYPLNREAFIAEWQGKLAEHFGKHFNVSGSGEHFRTVAHRLIEVPPALYQDASSLLSKLGKDDDDRDKKNRFDEPTIAAMISLLDELAQPAYAPFQRRGLVMFAEALLNATKAKPSAATQTTGGQSS